MDRNISSEWLDLRDNYFWVGLEKAFQDVQDDVMKLCKTNQRTKKWMVLIYRVNSGSKKREKVGRKRTSYKEKRSLIHFPVEICFQRDSDSLLRLS